MRVEEIVGEFASPTVLVNGHDVTGHIPAAHGSCRLDVPTEDQVIAALMRHDAHIVACNLSNSDLETQLERWRLLWAEAGVERAKTNDGMCLVFRDEPAVLSELQTLVTENECCCWVSWEVSREHGALSMRARSSGAGTIALHGMFDAGPFGVPSTVKRHADAIAQPMRS